MVSTKPLIVYLCDDEITEIKRIRQSSILLSFLLTEKINQTALKKSFTIVRTQRRRQSITL